MKPKSAMNTRGLLIAVVLSIIGAACGSHRDESAGARVDAQFAEWNKRDSPGCGVGVSRSGAIVFERGYGTANVERAVPISPSTVFDVASSQSCATGSTDRLSI